MDTRLSFDTTFLIDIQRELRAGGKGPAHGFLHQHPHTIMLLSTVALGEFSEGFESTEAPNLRGILAALVVLDIDRETALIYASVTRKLRRVGGLIGSNDLWIACTALRHDVSLVTRDTGHFGRVPGLRLVGY